MELTHKGQIVQWNNTVIEARHNFEQLLDECKDVKGAPNMKYYFYHLLDCIEQDVKDSMEKWLS